MKKILLFSLCSLLFALETSEASFVVPALPTTPVFDEVGLLSPTEKTALETTIFTLENETHHQLAIAIIKSLQGRTIEEASILTARGWGIGMKGLDNGLLIFVVPSEREVKIEVGRGLEGVITDLISKRIIEENFTPHFQNNEFALGLTEGIERMIPLLRGEILELPAQELPWTEKVAPFIALIFFFGWGILSILSSTKSWWLGGVFGGVIGVLFGGILIGGIGIVIGLIIDFLLSTYGYQKIPIINNFQSRRGIGGFGGGSSGGGWGGFGGGGFGGGGASGKW